MKNGAIGASRLPVWVRLLIAAGLLGALFAVADLQAVYGAIHAAQPLWMACAVAASLMARLLAAERNFCITRALQLPLRRAQVIVALFIANFWSLVLPGVSAGSVATVVQFRRHGAEGHSSLGALGASRFVELLAFAALGVTGLIFAAGEGPGESRRSFVWGAALVIGLIAGGGIVLKRLPPPIADPRTLGRRAWNFVLNVAATIRRLRTVDYVRGMATALVQATFDALILYFIGRALGVELDVTTCLWVNGLSYFTLLLPISIAGLGVREAAIVAALVPMGVTHSAALAIALLMLAVTLLNALIGAALQIRNAIRPRAEVAG